MQSRMMHPVSMRPVFKVRTAQTARTASGCFRVVLGHSGVQKASNFPILRSKTINNSSLQPSEARCITAKFQPHILKPLDIALGHTITLIFQGLASNPESYLSIVILE
eukprot:s599_g8.t1